MQIYHYDHDGVFTSIGKADESPLEPGVFLIPAYATTIAPPVAVNMQLRKFNGVSWGYVPVSMPQVPPTPEPVTVYPALTKVQFWLAALNIGVTKADVLALINQIVDPIAREQATIMLEETTSYKRDDPFVIQFSTMMGISSNQLNTLWIQATAL